MAQQKLRVVSDGTPMGTHVFAGDKEIEVERVEWSIAAGEPAKLIITAPYSDVEIEGMADVKGAPTS